MATNTKTASRDTYAALIKEVVEGTPIIPTLYLPYKSSDADLDTQKAMSGNIEGIHARYTESVLGVRNNKASVSFDMDYNVVGYVLHQMFGDPTTINNADGTFTHTFTLLTPYITPTYTWDFGKGITVNRFSGAYGGSMNITSNANDVFFNVDYSLVARRGLIALELESNSIAGSPTTLTFRTDAGFFANMLKPGDLITVGLGSGNQEDSVVIAEVAYNQITCNCINTHGIGDIVVIRQNPAPSYVDVRPASFVKPLNTVKIANDVAGLAIAPNITVDSITVSMDNNLDVRHGESSSDPYSIKSISTNCEVGFAKVATERELQEINRHNHAVRRAIEYFVSGEIIGTGTQREELRLQFPKVEITSFPIPVGSPDEIITATLSGTAVYDRVSDRLFTIVLTNTKASY
jgi:hypothetical protein